MTAAGGQGMHEQPHGLGEFSKESDAVPIAREATASPPIHDAVMGSESPQDVRGASLRLLHSPVLVPILVVLAVVGYGGLTVLWWERDRPQIGLSLSSAPVPTQSFRPTAALPAPRPPTESRAPAVTAASVPALAEKESPSRVPPREPIVPTVVRIDDTPHRVEQPAVPPDPIEALRPFPAAASTAPPVPLTTVATAPAPDDAVVAPPRLAEPRPLERIVTDRDAIGDVLQSYRAAYNSLDATSASTIWQGVDTRALQRAIATLSRKDVSFDRCEVRVTTADRAVASCRGVLLYVPKVGDGSPQERRLSWNFDFKRAADRWMISSVNAK
jgi:hypothetical protein